MTWRAHILCKDLRHFFRICGVTELVQCLVRYINENVGVVPMERTISRSSVFEKTVSTKERSLCEVNECLTNRLQDTSLMSKPRKEGRQRLGQDDQHPM